MITWEEARRPRGGVGKPKLEFAASIVAQRGLCSAKRAYLLRAATRTTIARDTTLRFPGGPSRKWGSKTETLGISTEKKSVTDTIPAVPLFNAR